MQFDLGLQITTLSNCLNKTKQNKNKTKQQQQQQTTTTITTTKHTHTNSILTTCFCAKAI